MDLAGERDRGECGDGEPGPPPLDREERERQQNRDRPEQVPGRLGDAVGREREREPADERRPGREAERPQPERREAARPDVGQEHEEVPARHGAEDRLEGPEHDRERPAGEVDARLELGLEAVRVEPRRLAAGELVAGKPEVVRRLEMVAGCDAALPRDAVAEEAVRLEDGGRGREQAGPEVERRC